MHPLPDVPNHGRGRDALATDMLAVYMSGWTNYSAELKEMVDAGDHVVLSSRDGEDARQRRAARS